MNKSLQGKVALVAGGTGGLGKSVALTLLAEGATVVVTYRKPDEFKRLQDAAGTAQSALEGYTADVIDSSAVEGLVKQILSSHGRLDVLVNTVGAFAGGTKLWETDPKTMQNMLSLNLMSGYTLARAIVPSMLAQGSGSIVNIASKAAVDHGAGAGAYAASKAGAVALMDSLAGDLKGTGVRVNSILPSIIDTEVNRRAMPTADFSTWPKPEEIARVILFLCSDDAKLIHGASIPVYGNS